MMHSIKYLSITISLIACFIVNGCDNSSESTANAYCESPAPLSGKLDPDAPGYIVVFNENIDTTTEVNRLINIYEIQVGYIYGTVLNGFFAEMTDDTREKLRCESSVDYIEYNGLVSASIN